MAKQVGLGRGLGALIRDTPEAEAPLGGGVQEVPLEEIRPNRAQPRQVFDAAMLGELTASIRQRGVMQPLWVRRGDDGYELIAGERRLRAAREAGLATVPVQVLEASDQEALELALVENLQREDLNLIEEAEGYRELAETFALTQADIAARVGKARATVANALRLLDLPAPVRDMVADGQLSAGHAKVLLGVELAPDQEALARRVVREQLSVRTLERMVAALRRSPRRRRSAQPDVPEEHLRHLCDVLYRRLGTGVRVRPSRTLPNGKRAKGSIEIDFYSGEELDRLLEILGVAEEL
jgi:ParB family transcriptional regulator, chromosome partitioning protein